MKFSHSALTEHQKLLSRILTTLPNLTFRIGHVQTERGLARVRLLDFSESNVRALLAHDYPGLHVEGKALTSQAGHRYGQREVFAIYGTVSQYFASWHPDFNELGVAIVLSSLGEQ